MIERTLAVLVVAPALAGCWAIGDPVYYYKAGVTEAEQQKDEDECLRIYRAGLDYLPTCMEKRGYMMDIGSKRKK